MALKKYVKYLGKTLDECEMCKTKVLGERWRYRSPQMVSDWIPRTLTICKKCAYRENFGSKFAAKAMKTNALKDTGNA
jgi:hypothetical protein